MTNNGLAQNGYYGGGNGNGIWTNGASNDYRDGTNGSHINGDVRSPAGDDEGVYDLLCIGFGPASLAIAIAMLDRGMLDSSHRVLFLERQRSFAWHSGMLLPGARMQISFLKDLATFRNPRSEFTFVNYLHRRNRLVNFTNLGTFLPLREEYNDYMAWCAEHFKEVVRYGHEAVSVSPIFCGDAPVVNRWEVISRRTDAEGQVTKYRAQNVVIAVGGRPSFPATISHALPHPRVIHSSQYSNAIPRLLDDPNKPYHIAVVGAGQSSAEIFNDLHSRYPDAKTTLFIRQHALKPSDDSPFVNEIFDPDRVDGMFALPVQIRESAIREDRATNYSVVRLNLLEELYNKLYHQRLREPDEQNWQHRIRPLHEVDGMDSDYKVRLKLRNTRTGEVKDSDEVFDAVIFGTGYTRDVHRTMLKPVEGLMRDGCCNVGRDYRVLFREGAVMDGASIFLQGCCQDTHGLSDTLLSILAVRAGELVDSIFGPELAGGAQAETKVEDAKARSMRAVKRRKFDGERYDQL